LGSGAHGGSVALLGGGLTGAGHDSAINASAKLLQTTANTVHTQEEGKVVGGGPAICEVARWQQCRPRAFPGSNGLASGSAR
jgi:hypothetical protein